MHDYEHKPVLPDLTAEQVMPWRSGRRRVIDGTVGCGGHSARILQRNPDAELLAIDRDEQALRRAETVLSFARGRIHFAHGNFSDLTDIAGSFGWGEADSILLDIGVSSPQIDDPERGFSYRWDGPLDMRMDRSSGLTAADLLNTAGRTDLIRIFREYGEVRESGRLADAVIRERETESFVTCAQFASVCDRVLGSHKRGTLPAPTLPFQAVRIAVNDELAALRTALDASLELLAEGGRLNVISFHSLEDRIVKQFMQSQAMTCKCPPGCPACICGWTPTLRILTKRPLTASDEEIAANPRSACAKLRCAERINLPIHKKNDEKIT